MRRLQRQRFQDEHIERALDEITRLIWHKTSSPGYQEENTLLLLVVKGRRPRKFTEKTPSLASELSRDLRSFPLSPEPGFYLQENKWLTIYHLTNYADRI